MYRKYRLLLPFIISTVYKPQKRFSRDTIPLIQPTFNFSDYRDNCDASGNAQLGLGSGYCHPEYR
jgi:hypothetical protein